VNISADYWQRTVKHWLISIDCLAACTAQLMIIDCDIAKEGQETKGAEGSLCWCGVPSGRYSTYMLRSAQCLPRVLSDFIWP
jgi:hypothetical protein